MIFAFDGLYDLDITYDADAPIFTLINDNGYKMIMYYWPIEYGGHQRFIKNYQNDQQHGTQYGWYSIQEGGHQMCIVNCQNDQVHGTQYWWYSIYYGGHLQYIANYKNDQKHGIQHRWRVDGSYYTMVY
jgi:hypothetical protein